jgi:UDP-N-acetylmuramoylalanine--D-glutamate ligase
MMKILLLGLGRANLAVAEYLVERGNDLFLYEEHMNTISEKGRAIIAKGRIKEYRDESYDLVITSPGFSEQNEIIKTLRAKGVRIIDEIEFTYQQLQEPKIIAVTGTNGKSTTAALISNILNKADKKAFLGGNISPGQPFSTSLFSERFDYYVLEVSSFQLMRIDTFRPYIAVLTNITRDHLNWHQDFNEYRNAKIRIFSNQEKSDYAIVNGDDNVIRDALGGIKSQVILFGSKAQSSVWFNSMFFYKKEKLFSVDTLALKGIHNRMNALASLAAAKIIGIDNDSIARGLMTFKSLPHRLEELGIKDGIKYINNSMCTNETAAIASLQAIKEPKIVIVGGKQKGDRADNYLSLLVQEAKACVVLGENAGQIRDFFERHNFSAYAIARTMDDALAKARGFAESGDTILLNPGFASFDYFMDFADRGEAFRNAFARN